ncbi:glutamyl aminopeptidase isoform X5 [Harmonia axyridis]|uniref:glutamyl aminopeptidase isoform X5 n=1 Tax=Harmonia axyridis TaxID=115357 RepID=UPI001E275B9D|nr:glutamyl aminopeptidase isoform X5 [Harmonia axyridis]
MIASEEKPHRRKKSCGCCVPCLCGCCVLQTILCVVLFVSLMLLANFILMNQLRKEPWKSQKIYRYPRLAETTFPVHYDLFIQPYLGNGTYQGLVNITLEIKVVHQEIILHSKNLDIKEVRLVEDSNRTVIGVNSVKTWPDDEVVVLNLTQKIVPSLYHLTMTFGGEMREKLKGLYQSQYLREDNETRTIATSKFEPTYAREAFPCFDEPGLKATFKVHIWKPNDSDYIALSNYPVESEEDLNGGKLVHFKETVKMSTYLVCFIVCDFNYTETFFENNGTNVPFRVYATPQQLEKTTYAGEVGKKTIEFYIKYFDIPYPLPKLDMIAIPDFSSGAMEHWGLVTYRETALLYTPKDHSSENKQRVLVVVAHELAHSWFGNLVTMAWWDNLWLNEGFASYIEYKGGHAAEPTFGLLDQFLVRELHPVLDLDAKISSHPVIQNVGTPDQITEVFDTISYNKGACVLRMLEQTVGEEKFRKGVTNYLKRYEYSNAVTKYLWREIQKVVGESIDVRDFMDTFTMQMGYPILNVTVEGDKLVLDQTRFLINPADADKQKPSPLNYTWTVPVTYITDKGKSEGIVWFNHTSKNVTIERPKDAKWIKFNPDQAGYYRVNYPNAMWKELGQHMLELPVSDRTHLLEEAFSIARSGQLSYEIPLELTKYLKDETNYTPWEVASSKLLELLKLLKASRKEQEFKHYVIKILNPIYKNLSWIIGKDDSHLKKLTRVLVLKLACEIEYDAALKDAANQLDIWFTTRTASPDLREIIYKYGMKNADLDKWEKLFKLFEEESDANEKLKLLRGLTAVNNPTLLYRLLDLAKDETYIRSQDYINFIIMMSRNPIGLPIVWDYVRENWDVLIKRFTLNSRYLGEMIPAITSSFSTNIKLAELNDFIAAHPEGGAGTAARERAIENIKNNILWLSKYKDTVEKWISVNSS